MWKKWSGVISFALIVGLWLASTVVPPRAAFALDQTISGFLFDAQDVPVSEAEVILLIEGEVRQTVESQENGAFVLPVEGETGQAVIEVERSHFEHYTQALTETQQEALAAGRSVTLDDITLERHFGAAFWVAALTFVGMLTLIALERLHNTLTALLAVAILFAVTTLGAFFYEDLFIFNFEQALGHVDFEVIFLLLGMMIVIGIIEETGIFQWLAYQAYRLSGGKLWRLAVILMLVTAFASALLDNVTTMLLMTPIILQIGIALGIDPLSLLLPAVLSSNIGGISTLVGTPTNILIGSYAGLSFNDFLLNLTPGVVIALLGVMGYVLLRYRKEYQQTGGEISPVLLAKLEKNAQIEHPSELRKAGIVFGGLLVLFVLGESIHMPPVMAAMIGAAAMLMWVNPDIEEMLTVVDWTTLVFFIGLFIVIGAVQEVGLIFLIANLIQSAVAGNLVVTILVIIWVAALMSGVVDNIPFAAAMLPVVDFLTRTTAGADSNVLFYSLSVGAAMGGNTSLIGASANLVAAGISRQAGYPITFRRFLAVGFPGMVVSVALGSLWILLRFGLLF